MILKCIKAVEDMKQCIRTAMNISLKINTVEQNTLWQVLRGSSLDQDLR